jgi:hypothetical protein
MYSRFAPLVAIIGAGAIALSATARADEPMTKNPMDSLGTSSPRPKLDLLRPAPDPRLPESVPTASVTLRRGTVKVIIAMFNRSARPAGTPLWCTAAIFGSSLTNFEGSSLPIYFAKATVTPAYAVCTVLIPYQMRVRDPVGAILSLFASVSSTVSSSALFDQY